MQIPPIANMWPCGVMVSTLDSESSDPSSNLGRTYRFFFRSMNICYPYEFGCQQ